VGALKAVLAAGLRVPEDVKIVSPMRCAVEGASPMKLTTVDVHREEQGRLAATELVAGEILDQAFQLQRGQ
jgi:DNA-binding LacI/PurR family transcriptional regulator